MAARLLGHCGGDRTSGGSGKRIPVFGREEQVEHLRILPGSGRPRAAKPSGAMTSSMPSTFFSASITLGASSADASFSR